MFDDKDIHEFDSMIRSILDEGQEDVPAGVWERVSEGLDKAQRNTVVLWWRRAAIGAAAAAAVAAGVFFSHTSGETVMPEASDKGMIAVAERPADEGMTGTIDIETVIPELVAQSRRNTVPAEEDMIIKTAGEALDAVTEEKPAVIREEKKKSGKEETRTESDRTKEHLPMEWGEEEKSEEKKRVSLVFSGIAATNDEQNKNRIGPMKAPTMSPAPQQTGITETSTKSTYGIPLSFGAGVRFDLTERWSLGAGLNYTFLNRQFYGKYTKVNEDGGIESSTSSDIMNTQHYLGIPINAYYNIIGNDRINLYAYAGGAVEKCLSDRYSLMSTSIHHKEKVKGVQLSANAGIGVEFMLGRHLGIYLDPSIRYYFDCGQPKSIRTVQPLMVGFEMGIRARL